MKHWNWVFSGKLNWHLTYKGSDILKKDIIFLLFKYLASDIACTANNQGMQILPEKTYKVTGNEKGSGK